MESPPHSTAGIAVFQTPDFRSELNDEQYAAVTAEPGPALVLAGAGSGKTRTLTYRVAWLRAQGIPPWQILLLTFTNKAAREMLGRVEELTGGTFSSQWGGTFHSIGGRFLRKHGSAIGVEPGYTILDESDSESLVTEVIKSQDAAFLKDKNNPKARAIRDLISFARNTRDALDNVVRERMPWAEELIPQLESFAGDYHELKRARQVADYDDLLELWLRVLQQDEPIRRHYQEQFQHILVDEYQDTNLLQSEIIDLLANRHQIMAVGDDAQCIYTWRGARFENIASFGERHPGATVYKIETNYRSTPQILDFANDVLADQPVGQGYLKMLRPVRAPNRKPQVVGVMDTRQQAHFLLKRIKGLLSEGYQLSDIAILYRAHYQAVDAQIEFSRNGLPFVITSGVRFFEQAHIRDLTAQLRFLANPRDATAFHRVACLLPRVGERTAQRLYSLVSKHAASEASPGHCRAMLESTILAKVPADAKADWTALAETLADAGRALAEPGDTLRPEHVVRVLVEGWYGDFLRTGSGLTNWEPRREDLESLIGFAQRFDDVNELLAQLVLLNSETASRAVDPDDDCVRMTTVHQAKGLEFPVVIVIGMADGFFPLKRAIESGDLDEERRLFYVSVTRAQDELYLCYPMLHTQGRNGGVMRVDPSRFLQEIPEDHYEHRRFDHSM